MLVNLLVQTSRYSPTSFLTLSDPWLAWLVKFKGLDLCFVVLPRYSTGLTVIRSLNKV